ncbi:MAG: ImmA/IrrE family metallo-endopeptidase [Calditrichaeota bacterium]|nr:MAG: ImmA/IrrE family metallo-endopeptidase [Calditrichota bacterium]
MNTVKIGDNFEDKSYKLILKAIKDFELGVSPNNSKIFQKKGYYSKDREKDIIFDLSIEIWPKNAKRFTILFLIECKSSNSKKVPVDDVEEFYGKIRQVAGVNVKGVMISDNSFQSGGVTFAKNRGMMLIEVYKDDTHSIILHRAERKLAPKKSIDEIFLSFIKKTLGAKKVIGLKKLSTKQIESHAVSILEKYNNLSSPIEICSFIEYLKKEFKLKFEFTKNLNSLNGKKIKGYYDIKKNKVFIDNSIQETNQFPFVLGHELGHFFLHNGLKMNQEVYNDFEDSEYDFFTDKFKLENDKNWIEWQANKFAISLFLPKTLFLRELINFRKEMGIKRHPEHIFLDNQIINQKDYKKTVEHLSNYFNTSKISVRFRIEELNLLTNAQNKPNIRSVFLNLRNE